ncbi:hypothetical protein J2Y41_004245 [Arthrobacter sp. 1088]|nr:hypothetical protein [Arthrobacter sp. 1088]
MSPQVVLLPGAGSEATALAWGRVCLGWRADTSLTISASSTSAGEAAALKHEKQ